MTKKQLEEKIKELESNILTQEKTRKIYGKGFYDAKKKFKEAYELGRIHGYESGLLDGRNDALGQFEGIHVIDRLNIIHKGFHSVWGR